MVYLLSVVGVAWFMGCEIGAPGVFFKAWQNVLGAIVNPQSPQDIVLRRIRRFFCIGQAKSIEKFYKDILRYWFYSVITD
jgi:hypothetical protein